MTDSTHPRWSTRFAPGTAVYFLSYPINQWREWIARDGYELEVYSGSLTQPRRGDFYFPVGEGEPYVLVERAGGACYRRLESEVFLSRAEADRVVMVEVMRGSR